MAIADLTASGVARSTVKTVDPTRSHARITFEEAEAEPLGHAGEGWDLLLRVCDRAAVLMAFEQLGGAAACLRMARGYALERYAFGRPIGSFQAVKHRLADMYIKIELARSNCYYGAWALWTDAAELPVAAAGARVAATEAFNFASKENIQIHGGIGCTWESDCHLFYRRAKLLGLSLGSLVNWKNWLIDRIESGATVQERATA
jgi:acyl-CoA dehydrogenase